MKIPKEGYVKAITSLLISGYNYSLPRYISMHRSYNHTWLHMVSLLFVADIHVNLLYLDALFLYSY